MHLFATTTAEQALELGKGAAFVETEPQVKSGRIPDAVPNRKRQGR
jgi:hypothetical protein